MFLSNTTASLGIAVHYFALSLFIAISPLNLPCHVFTPYLAHGNCLLFTPSRLVSTTVSCTPCSAHVCDRLPACTQYPSAFSPDGDGLTAATRLAHRVCRRAALAADQFLRPSRSRHTAAAAWTAFYTLTPSWFAFCARRRSCFSFCARTAEVACHHSRCRRRRLKPGTERHPWERRLTRPWCGSTGSSTSATADGVAHRVGLIPFSYKVGENVSVATPELS